MLEKYMTEKIRKEKEYVVPRGTLSLRKERSGTSFADVNVCSTRTDVL